MESKNCRTCRFSYSWQWNFVADQWEGVCSLTKCPDCQNQLMHEEESCKQWER